MTHSLSLAYKMIDDESLMTLLDGSDCINLDLSNNQIKLHKEECLNSFLSFLTNNKKLESINLANNELKHKQVIALAKTIAELPNIKKVDFSFNSFKAFWMIELGYIFRNKKAQGLELYFSHDIHKLNKPELWDKYRFNLFSTNDIGDLSNEEIEEIKNFDLKEEKKLRIKLEEAKSALDEEVKRVDALYKKF